MRGRIPGTSRTASRERAARSTSVLALLVLHVGALVLAGCEASPVEDVLEIDSTMRSMLQRTSSTAGDTAIEGVSQLRTLPDAWSMAERKKFSGARYRADLMLAAVPTERWSIYLPRADMNASVRLNGVPLGQIGRMRPPIERMRHHPMLFPIDASNLRVGENSIEVELAVEETSSGALAPFFAGAERVLRPRHALRRFVQITLLQIFVAGAFVLAVVVATVYSVRRRGASHGWFLLAIGLWALYTSEVWVREPFVGVQAWEAIANTALYASVWALMIAFHRSQAVVRPRIETGVLLAIAATAGLFLWLPPHFIFPFRGFSALGLCALAVYMVNFVTGASEQTGIVLERRHAVVGAVGLGIGAHDLLSAPFGYPLAGLWLEPYIGGLTVVVTLGVILQQLVIAVGESQSLQVGLEEQVAERAGRLELHYAELRELAAQTAVRRERDRLAETVHDGLGSTLVSTVAMLESNEGDATVIASRVRDALDDLRVLIDSLDPQGGLLDLLAGLRSRFAARLGRNGITIRWQVGDVPPIEGFESEHMLCILRVLHRVLASLDLRPQARFVTVSTDVETRSSQPGVIVEIADDGGFLEAKNAFVRLWDALREDARQAGVVFEATSDRRGIRVRLWLPTRLSPMVES